ncbi:MAG TPA: hypothetical protein VLJ60_00015, partial [bacterium]|nr:hypothetical protein [bacterium]
MKKRLMFLILFVFFAGCSDSGIKNNDIEETDDNYLEEVDDSVDESAVEDENEDENDEDIIEEFKFDIQRIYNDVAWFAHADRTGRQPGTPGNVASVEYVKSLFEELGLT